MIRIISATTVTLWFFLSLYLGCGGITSLELSDEKDHLKSMIVDKFDTVSVIYNGMSMKNRSYAELMQAENEYNEKRELAASIFPWLDLPYSFIGLLITSFAFGAFGGTVSILKEIVLDDCDIENCKVFSKPLLGASCGIIILIISYILPLLIVTGETQVRSISIVLVSIFGGLFSARLFKWLSSVFGNIFQSKVK